MLRKMSSDRQYYRIRYFLKFGHALDLKNPRTFNAKLHWLKLHNRKRRYGKLVDKYEVRSFVANTIGSQYLVPLIGIYTNVEEINFDQLPDSFVLKGTHGAGWVLLCATKKSLDIPKVKVILQSWLSKNFYEMWGEHVYKEIPPRIICEAMLKPGDGSSLTDYKFFCFDGVPKFLNTVSDRFGKHTKDFYDLEWNHLPFSQGHARSDTPEPKPALLDDMIRLATHLSQGFKMIRLDLYQLDGKIYFGEFTFFPSNGLTAFSPSEVDLKRGELIDTQ